MIAQMKRLSIVCMKGGPGEAAQIPQNAAKSCSATGRGVDQTAAQKAREMEQPIWQLKPYRPPQVPFEAPPPVGDGQV